MARSCKMCGGDVDQHEDDDDVSPSNRRGFCSVKCEVKHDHIREDARDARLADMEEAQEPAPGRRP